jgi:hypothetical protein
MKAPFEVPELRVELPAKKVEPYPLPLLTSPYGPKVEQKGNF